jgi:NAD(P)-dependent dehydrogenase (short-subunit alcohol dehydrogenase family)
MTLTWLVTGANRGIGLELAKRLAARGDLVVGTARDPQGAGELEMVAERVLRLDVADPESVASAAAALGGMAIDALVNNAGSAPVKGSIGEMDLAEFERAMAIHALGPVRVTRALMPNLRAGRRRLIVTLSSELGSNEIARKSVYYGYKMGKAAANMFTSTLGTDLAGEGFTCLAIHPGWVATRMGGESAPITPEESAASMLATFDRAGPGMNGAYVDRFGEGMAY